MHQIYSFKDVLDHVTSGGRAYIVADAPLNYIKGTSQGVMWGDEGVKNSLIPAPLQHCIWGAKYVIFAGVKPVSITSYQDYTCIKATNNITTLFTVFDDNGKKVHSGDELYGVFSLQEWADALPTPF